MYRDTIELEEAFFDGLEVIGYRATGMQDEPAPPAPAPVEWSPEEDEQHYQWFCRREAERVARQLQAVAEEIVREAAKPAAA